MVVLGLFIILLLVLVLPFSVKYVEEELEGFLFVMGLVAASISGTWSLDLLREAASSPLLITGAVLASGFAFRALRPRLQGWARSASLHFGRRMTVLLLVSGLGLLSSLITAIMAALLLVELLHALNFPRPLTVKIAILACFSIGLGSMLTPAGGPLASIAIARLSDGAGGPGVFFLARQLGAWIVPMVLALGLGAALLKGEEAQGGATGAIEAESVMGIFLRAGKVYIFVAGLVFLGRAFNPLVGPWVASAPAWAIYWVNSLSAVLDNATLAAAEISPGMSPLTLKFSLLGLALSGGMLIPGNIPNIICAGKLKITARQWARYGLPLGLALMAAVFSILMFF